MEKIINVLLVEDSKFDAELIMYNLGKAGMHFYCERVYNEASMRKTLMQRNWDIILSDHLMPSFNSIEALALRNEICPCIPFFIVSSCIDDSLIKAALDKGCRTCIPKSSLGELAKRVKEELKLL